MLAIAVHVAHASMNPCAATGARPRRAGFFTGEDDTIFGGQLQHPKETRCVGGGRTPMIFAQPHLIRFVEWN